MRACELIAFFFVLCLVLLGWLPVLLALVSSILDLLKD